MFWLRYLRLKRQLIPFQILTSIHLFILTLQKLSFIFILKYISKNFINLGMQGVFRIPLDEQYPYSIQVKISQRYLFLYHLQGVPKKIGQQRLCQYLILIFTFRDYQGHFLNLQDLSFSKLYLLLNFDPVKGEIFGVKDIRSHY